jgi:hypothetical protein
MELLVRNIDDRGVKKCNETMYAGADYLCFLSLISFVRGARSLLLQG